MRPRRTDIALFLPSLAGGGAERVFVKLAELFADQGLHVDLVLARCDGTWLQFVPKTVRLVDLRKTKPSLAIPSLIRYLRSTQPRAIMSAMTHANIALAIAHRLSGVNCRCVLSERADIAIALPKEKVGFDLWLTIILGRWVYPWADAIVAVSNGVGNSVVQVFKLPKCQVNVIYNPIDQERILVLGREAVQFPWCDALPVVVSVGRLHKPKCFDDLLHAFAVLRLSRPSHLVILGEGEERDSLVSLAANLGITEDLWMPGFAANPFAYMAKANLFVLSSHWEGLPNALIEALALGIPVVSTRCPSGPEEVLENGRYGRLVPVGDVSALASAMEKSLSGDHPQFDRMAALERFRPDWVVSQYFQILNM